MTPEIRQFEYSVRSRASREHCWAVYCDWQNWNGFAHCYGELVWSGTPWQPGSRLQISLLHPIPVRIDHVIISCDLGTKIGWIDYGMSITIEQYVLFIPLPNGGTEIRTHGEFVGAPSSLVIDGIPVEDLVRQFMQTWYTSFAAHCDQLNHASGGLPVRIDESSTNHLQ